MEKALDAIRKQHKWGDISDAEYRTEREQLLRAFADIPRVKSEPLELSDCRKAAILFGDLGNLWSHPGVSDAQRKAFIEEVFEQIQIDELGVRAMKPAEEYLPLVAVAEWGDIARENLVSRSISP